MGKQKALTKEEKERKKKLAFSLYVDNRFDQKVISEITGISEHSISTWKKNDASSGLDWDEERRIANMGPDKQMRRIMKIYDVMLNNIEDRKAPDNVPKPSEADILSKLAITVERLSADLTQFVKMEVGKQVITYVQETYGQAKAIELIHIWHEYLMATS